MTDEEILLNFANSPNDAVEIAYAKFGKKVYNTIFNILRDTQEAEEITQDVFVKVYSSFESFQKESKLSTWIYRIAVNKSLDALRRKNRKKSIQRITRFFNSENPKEQEIAKDFWHPGASLENQELTKTLFEAIDSLPENQRLAYILVKVQNMSYQEAAESLDKSISSLESLLVRANKNLREILAGFYDQNYR